MKKIIAMLLTLVMAVGLLAGCGSSSGSAPATAAPAAPAAAPAAEAAPEAAAPEFDGEFKIGVVTWLSGTGKETGDRQVAAAEVAAKKINDEGGVNGAKLVLQYFDAGSGQQEAVNAVQLACNTDGLSGVVGMFQSAYAIAYSDAVKNAKIPCMCLGTSYNVRDQKNPYMWQPRVCDQTTSEALARLCVERGITKPCIMWMTNSSGQSQHDACVAYFEEHGIEVGLDLGFNVETETDYTPIVTQFLNSDCDGIVIIANSVQGAPEIVTLLNQYGFDMSKAAGVSSLFSSDLTDMVGDITNGMFGIAEFSPKMERAGTQNYIAAFEGSQSLFTSAWTDAITYDAVLLLAEGARLSGDNSAEGVNTGLAKLTNYTEGALCDYNFYEDHCLGSSLLVSEYEGSNIVFTDIISAR